MDTTKKDTVPQRRANDWKEVLLYEKLRRGSKTTDTWPKTLDHLHDYLLDEGNQRRLVRQLLNGETDKDWTDEQLKLYLDDAVNVCRKITAYTTSDLWQESQLQDMGHHVHRILAQQNRKERSTEELFQDFLNAGTVEPPPTAPDVACFVTDHHGKKTLLPKCLLPESFNWPIDKILADPDPSEGRPFKSDDGQIHRPWDAQGD